MADSAAERAGVRNGDRLIWINGVMTSTLTPSTLSRTVRVRPPQSKASIVKQDVKCVTVSAGREDGTRLRFLKLDLLTKEGAKNDSESRQGRQ